MIVPDDLGTRLADLDEQALQELVRDVATAPSAEQAIEDALKR